MILYIVLHQTEHLQFNTRAKQRLPVATLAVCGFIKLQLEI